MENFYAGSFRPERIIVLIDDIFDIYGRLSAPERDNLFSEEAAIGLTNQRMVNSVARGTAYSRELTPTEKSLNLGITRIGSIQQLVAWRRAEMQFAENLAAQSDLDLHLVAVKHPMQLMDLLLKSGSRPTVAYVSHPITTQRWSFLSSETSQWPSYVHRINDLPGHLVDYDIAAISPTTIDEARFQPPTQEYVHHRDGAMLPRWPLSSKRKINTSEHPAMHHEHSYTDEIFNSDPAVSSGYVKALQVLLSDDVPYRDHYIIVHTPNFIAYQTRENGASQSGGVKYEINHFAELADQESDRRMVSVHDLDDARAILAKGLDKDSTAWRVAHNCAENFVIDSLISSYSKISLRDAAEILRYGGLTDSPLQSGLLLQTIEDVRNTALDIFCASYTYIELSGLDSIREWCLVLIDDLNQHRQYEIIRDWLKRRYAQNGTYAIPTIPMTIPTESQLDCADGSIMNLARGALRHTNYFEF
ncbi:hypothetical protein [Mycolicibacterium frederiksbergense]|uniref:hypothetical protein n=1 Tax=Mycolicibacterium frederiksbergense TaxID=117567 RepID=UPI00265BAAB9|nr:hypothetical protein [Mycolicibacterium frederiksbergense]MDO0978135.1 hypothetical protein [Mycolicibacterium frederiksbergense]